jgi:hypothetical protein
VRSPPRKILHSVPPHIEYGFSNMRSALAPRLFANTEFVIRRDGLTRITYAPNAFRDS